MIKDPRKPISPQMASRFVGSQDSDLLIKTFNSALIVIESLDRFLISLWRFIIVVRIVWNSDSIDERSSFEIFLDIITIFTDRKNILKIRISFFYKIYYSKLHFSSNFFLISSFIKLLCCLGISFSIYYIRMHIYRIGDIKLKFLYF